MLTKELTRSIQVNARSCTTWSEVVVNNGVLTLQEAIVSTLPTFFEDDRDGYSTSPVVGGECALTAVTEKTFLYLFFNYVFATDQDKQSVLKPLFGNKVLKSRVKQNIYDVCSSINGATRNIYCLYLTDFG